MLKKKIKFSTLIYWFVFFISLFFLLGVFTRTYVHKNKAYYEKDKVALYIMKYDGELPTNFITKSQAKKQYPDLYYKKAYYEVISQGKNIGGGPHKNLGDEDDTYSSKIYNYTHTTDLKECDIYIISNQQIAENENRGSCRLVYSSDGNEVYYTSDHYEHFEKITAWKINKTSNVFYILFAVTTVGGICCVIIGLTSKNEDDKKDVITALKNSGLFLLGVLLLPIIIVVEIIDTVKKKKQK